MRVTYVNKGNYFTLKNINEAQSTKLLKLEDGKYREVGSAKIVSTDDVRSGTNYGTVVLNFYSGNALYVFEKGATYAVRFDIIADGFHHSTPKDGKIYLLSGYAM
jgi:hypothetical protein